MLSPLERNFVFSTIEKCHSSSTPEDLQEAMSCFLERFIPHKMSVCSITNVETKVHLQRFEFGCPPGVMDAMSPSFCMTNNPLLPLWKKKRLPQYGTIEELAATHMNADQRAWQDMLYDHGIMDVAMHGVLDMAGKFASFFYLSGLPSPLSDHQKQIFAMLVPHLHHALLNVARCDTTYLLKGEEKHTDTAMSQAQLRLAADKPDFRLTPREAEILKCVYHGKTNSETATILGISDLTVRNHMQNLMLKLGVGNRTQAVVKAMQNNIFSGSN